MPYTLTINFTLASPDPGSYRVRFWPTSNPSNVTTRLISTSPFVEYNLPETSYAGTIEASCGGGAFSSPQSFTATFASPTPTVVSATAGFEPCVGGSIDDHLGGSITLSGNVATDTPFTIEVVYAPAPYFCNTGPTFTLYLSGTVLAGQSTGVVDACTQGAYVASGGTVCSAIGTLN